MKAILWPMIVSMSAMIACGDGGASKEQETPADSQMVAEHVDPSTKFPQQVIATDTLQTDANFVDNAVQSAEQTITLADLAAQKAMQPEVKKVAQDISRDQKQLVGNLRAVQKPREAKDSTQQYSDGSKAGLEKLTGVAFDREWVNKMITWNGAVISRYETESGAAKDKGIKKIVDDALKRLKAHQEQLETCRNKLQ